MSIKQKVTIFLLSLTFLSLNSKENKNMIWEVSSFGENKIYVLGSIHAASDELYPLKKIVEEKYMECTQIAVEADITKKITNEAQNFLQDNSFCRDKEISNYISEEDLISLKKICGKYNLNFDIYKRYKPWFWAMTLENLKIEHTKLDFEKGIDLYFIKKAKNDKKEILELEGFLEQIKLLSDLSDSIQISFLELAINDSLDYEMQLSEIANAWKVGNTTILEHILFQEFKKNKQTMLLYEKLVVERNIRIAKRIEEYLSTEENVFVIAGAAHFIGSDSVLQMLRKKGYFIMRL